jgi:DivIVA domain-containing protein
VADFLLLVIGVLVVAAVAFGIVVFAFGHDPGLSDPEPPGPFAAPPSDRPVTGEDLAAARFDVVVRGYRMEQVDAVLGKAAEDLRELQAYADSLEDELTVLRRVPDSDRA